MRNKKGPESDGAPEGVLDFKKTADRLESVVPSMVKAKMRRPTSWTSSLFVFVGWDLGCSKALRFRSHSFKEMDEGF